MSGRGSSIAKRGGRGKREARGRGWGGRQGSPGGREWSEGAWYQVPQSFLVNYISEEGSGILLQDLPLEVEGPLSPKRVYQAPTDLTVEDNISTEGVDNAMVVYTFLVGYIPEEGSGTLLQGLPLEVPLTPPQRSRVRQAPTEMSGRGDSTVKRGGRGKRGARVRGREGRCGSQGGIGGSCSAGNKVPQRIKTSKVQYAAVVTAPPHVEMTPPSPAAFESYDASRDECEVYGFNYGSDDDSASDTESNDDDGAPLPVFVPRANRIFFNEDDDDDDYHPHVQTPEPAHLAPTEPLEYGPKDLFHFDWVNITSVPVAPTERRERFRAGEVGPLAVYPSPYEAFTAIWTPEFMQTIVVETNRYAQHITRQKIRDGSLGPTSRITQWHDTNVDELYVYFALILASGECIKGKVKDYWSKGRITSTPGFGDYMSFNRMTLLNSCLHFVDNTTDLRTLTKSQARIFKITPVIRHLNDRFQTLYRLDRNIVIDESLAQWKGLLPFKRFFKNKVAGQGIKTFEVCESQTGYLWRFEVYSGREEDTKLERPASVYIVNLVLKLLKGLEDKGYTVWMNNYYNSPALARILKSLGFDCVGTLRTNRQGVPPQIKNLKENDMTIGQISGCTSGDVDILVWRDINRISMISTYHSAAVHTCEGKTKPVVAYDYNVCMSGVDKKDQMLSAYPIERKRSRVWYKKFFRRLLNASVLNAFLLHRERAPPDTLPHIRQHRVFREVLLDQLLERHHKPCRNLTPMRIENQPKPRVMLPQEVLNHFPKQFGFSSNSTRVEKIRRRCVLCHKRQRTYCPACNVPLCMDNCIITYHRQL